MSTEDNTTKPGEFTLRQWAESPIAAYDRYDEYMEHVDPLVTALQAECRKRGLPMAFIVGHTQHADGNTAVAQGMTVPNDLRLVPGEVLQVSAAAQGNVGEVLNIAGAEALRLQAHRATAKAMAGVLDA